MRFALGRAVKRDGFCRQKRSIRFLLEGCADGVCAGGRVAGADVDLFSRTGAGAVVIRAVGYVAGNAVIFFAGLAGVFRRIVVHGGSSFQSKISNDVSFFRTVLFARSRGFMQSEQNFRTNIPLCAEYITRATREYHLG